MLVTHLFEINDVRMIIDNLNSFFQSCLTLINDNAFVLVSVCIDQLQVNVLSVASWLLDQRLHQIRDALFQCSDVFFLPRLLF